MESHTEMSHAISVKHLLDNRIAYCNESFPSSGAFIGQHNPHILYPTPVTGISPILFLAVQ